MARKPKSVSIAGARDYVERLFQWRPSEETVRRWIGKGIDGRTLCADKRAGVWLIDPRDLASFVRYIEPLIPSLSARANHD